MICIPSYQREETCLQKTISTLERHDLKQATVFVVSEEYDKYRTIMPEWVIVSIGVKGIVEQRQFIMEQYPENTNIVYMDDDLEEIDVPNLKEFIKNAFIQCRKKGAYLWGVYPIWNPFFRNKSDTTCLNFCIGCFYGIINRHDHDLNIVISKQGNKEDVERSIRYFIKDGIVLRFNKVGVKTKFFSMGGIGIKKERMDEIQKETMELAKAFKEYGTVKIRKDGRHEFVLRKIN
jgi:hypothetical protein